MLPGALVPNTPILAKVPKSAAPWRVDLTPFPAPALLSAGNGVNYSSYIKKYSRELAKELPWLLLGRVCWEPLQS